MNGFAPLRTAIAARPLQRLLGLAAPCRACRLLLIAPCRDIHTAGMRTRIDVAFVDADGIVAQAHRNVSANRRLRCRHAVIALERPAEDTPWFSTGDALVIGAQTPCAPSQASAEQA